MLFEESDIKFENLNPNEFEELCFDLLTQFGFESLIWRQGGADSGRDIEAQYTISNPLVGNYKERWFVECKLYNQGVPVNEISSKIYWAEAERPQHLVIIVSSYLSQSAREWLEKRTASVQFRTHLIEGKQLKQLILGCTDIVEKYFIDKNCKLLKDAIQNWFSHGLLPDINIMYLFYQKIDKEKLTIPELAFLWSAWLMQYHEIEESAKNLNTNFSFLSLINFLIKYADSSSSLIDNYQIIGAGRFRWVSYANLDNEAVDEDEFHIYELIFDDGATRQLALYSFYACASGEGLEIIVTQSNLKPTANIRYIKLNARKEKEAAFEAVYNLITNDF